MKSEQENYNNLLMKLKKAESEINSVDVLTDQIMVYVNSKVHKTKPQMLIWIRTISSAAAIYLLILFSYQHATEVTEIPTELPQKSIQVYELYEKCFSINEMTGITERYKCYIRHKKNTTKKYQAFNNHLNSINNENND